MARPALKPAPWRSLLTAIAAQCLLPLQLKQVETWRQAGCDHDKVLKR